MLQTTVRLTVKYLSLPPAFPTARYRHDDIWFCSVCRRGLSFQSRTSARSTRSSPVWWPGDFCKWWWAFWFVTSIYGMERSAAKGSCAGLWWSGCRWLENMRIMAPWHHGTDIFYHVIIQELQESYITYTLHSTPINTSHQTHHTYFATTPNWWKSWLLGDQAVIKGPEPDAWEPMQERGVEAIHARVTQALAGGRPLSAPGLGMELKWNGIESLLQTSPQAGQIWCAAVSQLSHYYSNYSTQYSVL